MLAASEEEEKKLNHDERALWSTGHLSADAEREEWSTGHFSELEDMIVTVRRL